jgi:hypothetical protein
MRMQGIYCEKSRAIHQKKVLALFNVHALCRHHTSFESISNINRVTQSPMRRKVALSGASSGSTVMRNMSFTGGT